MECRSFSLERLEALARSIADRFREAAAEAGASVEIETTASYETFRIDRDHRTVQRFEAVCASLGLSPTLAPGGGGSDANVYALHGAACLVLACGMTDVHSVHESLSLEDLYDATRLARALMTAERP